MSAGNEQLSTLIHPLQNIFLILVDYSLCFICLAAHCWDNKRTAPAGAELKLPFQFNK